MREVKRGFVLGMLLLIAASMGLEASLFTGDWFGIIMCSLTVVFTVWGLHSNLETAHTQGQVAGLDTAIKEVREHMDAANRPTL